MPFAQRLQAALDLQRQGRTAEAGAAYARLLTERPDHPDLLHLSGLALAEAGTAAAGLARVQAAVALAPANPLYLANLGLLQTRLGRHREAAASYVAALDADPIQPTTWYHLGNCRSALGEPAQARDAYRRAIGLRPDYLRAWINLAGVLRDLGEFDEARAALERVLERQPGHPTALNNLANLRRECGDPFTAVALGQAALGHDPASHSAWNNLGSALRESGRLNEALDAYGRALVLKPDHPEAHLNLAMALLAAGDYRRGWQEYEWRWQAARESQAARRDLPMSQWRGEPLAGQSILLHAEQGLGDALQFVRYAPWVAGRGGRVILECQPELVRLFARIPGVVQAIPRGEPLPVCDWHCPFMSLPLAFGTELATIPGEVPYLIPDPEAVAAWAARLPPAPRVGLVWAGNPRRHDPVSHRIDRRRSLDLARFAGLAESGPITWVSLQQGTAVAGPLPLLDAMAGVTDFLDTAALVANLDLVIAVDTSVAHLAGALGRPVWLLSRFDACWRWLEGRDDSPWYPTMRLFRQRRYGDWDGVLAELAGALHVWVAEFGARDPGTGAAQRAEQIHGAGLAAAQGGDALGAVDLLQRAAALMPASVGYQADLGLAWSRLGDQDRAAAAYRRALALDVGLDPALASVCFNLGNALVALDQSDAAEAAYRQALARRPGYTKARVNLANLRRGRGDLSGAAEILTQALADEPGHPGARSNLGLVLSEAGRHAEALAILQPLIAARPVAPGPWQQFGVVLHQAGRAGEAAAAFREALARDPERAETWCNLAGAELACERVPEAQAAAERAVQLAPDLARAWQALGAARLKAEDFAGAVAACRRVTELASGAVGAWDDLATALRGAGQFEEAIAACDQGLRLDPRRPSLLANRAGAQWERGRPEEAAADCERALALRSDDAETWNSLGIARHLRRDLAGADLAYGRALALDPAHAAARMNRALVLLTWGDYAEGWREYEWRWEGARGGRTGRRDFAQPQWRGEPLAGQSILLHAEQGLGDALQFARYAPLVARRGGRVVLECYPELQRLFRSLPGVAQVLAQGEPLPETAWQCPLMSLPLAFGTELSTIPADLPYLHPEPAEAARWAQRLAGWPGPRVGLAWAGSPRPQDPVSHRIDRRRSLRLERLAPVLDLPGLTFVSLQKGQAAGQAEGRRVLDFTAELDDFAATAALAINLDLVIAVDTSVAHLAAALGRPVWLLSRFDACWRWLDGRDDSPWYPGLRLFRQRAPGDWDGVVARLAEALADWMRGRGASSGPEAPVA